EAASPVTIRTAGADERAAVALCGDPILQVPVLTTEQVAAGPELHRDVAVQQPCHDSLVHGPRLPWASGSGHQQRDEATERRPLCDLAHGVGDGRAQEVGPVFRPDRPRITPSGYGTSSIWVQTSSESPATTR